jgi:hypothetical protein
MFSSRQLMCGILLAAAPLLTERQLPGAKQPSGEASPVSVLVTAEGPKDAPPPELTQKDALVFESNQRLAVTGWTPAASVEGGSQLWVLIDDGSDTVLGIQLADLKKFIQEQPATTRIGIGYLDNGSVRIGQSLTSDHELAAKAIRLPNGMAGISASPYLALIELIQKKWPDRSQASQVLLVTSGIDPDYGPGPDNPYLLQAIDVAQRAGVMVSAIYFGGAGHVGHSYWQITWGQNNLSRIAEETGGEFYWQGASNPVSFGPYLQEMSHRMQAQYVLTFLAKPESKAGLQRIRLRTEVSHISLVGQQRVWVSKGN